MKRCLLFSVHVSVAKDSVYVWNVASSLSDLLYIWQHFSHPFGRPQVVWFHGTLGPNQRAELACGNEDAIKTGAKILSWMTHLCARREFATFKNPSAFEAASDVDNTSLIDLLAANGRKRQS